MQWGEGRSARTLAFASDNVNLLKCLERHFDDDFKSLMAYLPVRTRAIKLLVFISVTTACAKRTGAAASLECRRREPARAISPE